MKQVSGGAACSDRDSTKSTQKQDAATANPMTGTIGHARRTGFEASRASLAKTTVATSPATTMRRSRGAPRREPRAERPSERDPEADGVARHVRVEDVEVERLPAEAEHREREDEDAEERRRALRARPRPGLVKRRDASHSGPPQKPALASDEPK